MKKQIISNTIMFIAIMLFVVLFSNIFGQANKMVGIVVLIIGLVISEKDLTQNLKVLTVQLVIINLFMGIASYFANLNPFLGLLFNIPFIFYVTYMMVAGNKKPYHFPFILGYLFLLLTSPITNIVDLPGRLIALIAGSLMIVGLQYLFNKDTYKKILKAENEQVLNILEKRLNRILNYDLADHPEEIEALENSMQRFMKVTYERRNFKSTLTQESMHRVTEMITLEKIYHLLGRLGIDYKENMIEKNFLDDLKQLINDLKNNDFSCGTKLLKKWDEQVLTGSEFELKQAIYILKASENNDYPLRKENLLKQMMHIDKESLAYKFALRLTILLTIGIFITGYFNLEYGRWLCFTILALVQPRYEESNKKTWMRFVGTGIGVVIFLILFNIFTNQTARTMIVLCSSYIGMYINRYDLKMIVTTVQALGAAIIGTTGAIVIQNRIYLVLLGGVIAYLGNKYLFTIREQQEKLHYAKLYEEYKTYLENHPERYPHAFIVETYHVLDMGKQKEHYKEWLDISFDALAKAI